ncbi:MAG: prepilin-type N-terminal cleavage/methylation domain-containing protein [Phycisphaerales bacterium]
MLRTHALRPGFTLLEMMLVVVIMGILATVAVVSMSGQTNKARRDATIARMRQVKVALEEYNGRYAVYPPSLTVLTVGSGKALETAALNDSWNRPFNYAFPGSSGDPEQPYDLYSAGGAAGAARPEDLINVWTIDKK